MLIKMELSNKKVLMLIKASFQGKETLSPLKGKNADRNVDTTMVSETSKKWEMRHSEQFLYTLGMVTVS